MSEYKTVHTQHENLKRHLKELEVLANEADHAWHISGDDDENKYREMMETEERAKDVRKSVKELAYRLVVLEYKELGTSLTQLAKKYGVTSQTAKRLLEKSEITYLTHEDRILRIRYDQIVQLHEKISRLEDIVAKIQYTNLRRDMNLKTRTQEIDNLCKEKWKQK